MQAIYDERWGNRTLCYFFDYVPARFKYVSLPQESARNLIWNFKNGTHQSGVALHTAKLIKQTYGKTAKDIAFVCIPASTPEKNQTRYFEFSKLVCAMCGTQNAFRHIALNGERMAVHEQGRTHSTSNSQIIEFDSSFFANGRKVILFDDVVTSGRSIAMFAEKLESMGAEVIAAYCIGKTLVKPSKPTTND